jgi:hypothetical protein
LPRRYVRVGEYQITSGTRSTARLPGIRGYVTLCRPVSLASSVPGLAEITLLWISGFGIVPNRKSLLREYVPVMKELWRLGEGPALLDHGSRRVKLRS